MVFSQAIYRTVKWRLPPRKAIQQFAKAAEVTRGGNVNVDQLIVVAVSISIPVAGVIV